MKVKVYVAIQGKEFIFSPNFKTLYFRTEAARRDYLNTHTVCEALGERMVDDQEIQFEG